MTSTTADFTVRLVDKVTGGSKSVRRSLGQLEKDAKKLGRSIGGKLLGTKGGILGERGAGGKFKKGKQGLLDDLFGKKSDLRRGAADTWKSIAGGNLATQAINKTLEAGAAAVSATADYVMFGERARLALDQLGSKHGASGEKLFEHARTLAKRFGSDVVDTTENLQKLLGAQFSAKLATDIIKMGADLRTVGATAEDTKGAIRAISQIKGAGKLQGDELMQLAEAGISVDLVRKKIGEALGGKSVSEVIKLQEGGKIDADTAIAGILGAVKAQTGAKELGEAGAKWASSTIEGMLGRGKALAQDAGLKITERITGSLNKYVGGKLDKFWGFLESPEGVAMVDKIGGALDRVIGIGAALGEGAGAGFGAVMDAVGPLLDKLGGGDGTTAVQVAKSLGKVLGFAAASAVVLGAAAVAVGGALYFVEGAIVEGSIAAFDSMVAGIGDVILWFDDLDAKIRRFATDVWDSAVGIGTAIVDGIVSGLESAIGAVGEAFSNLGSSMIGALKAAIDMHSPPGAFVDIGSASAGAVAIGSSAGESQVASAGWDLGSAHLGGTAAGMSGSSSWGGAASGASFDLPLTTTASSDLPTSYASPAMANAAGVAAASGGGGVTVGQITVQVTVEGSGTSDPEQLGELVGSAVERRIDEYFRRFDLE